MVGVHPLAGGSGWEGEKFEEAGFSDCIVGGAAKVVTLVVAQMVGCDGGLVLGGGEDSDELASVGLDRRVG